MPNLLFIVLNNNNLKRLYYVKFSLTKKKTNDANFLFILTLKVAILFKVDARCAFYFWHL